MLHESNIRPRPTICHAESVVQSSHSHLFLQAFMRVAGLMSAGSLSLAMQSGLKAWLLSLDQSSAPASYHRQLCISDVLLPCLQQGKTQLAKGDYTIRILLRHDNVAILEKLRDKVCVVERELTEKVTVPIYRGNSDSIKAANSLKDSTLHPGETTSQLCTGHYA